MWLWIEERFSKNMICGLQIDFLKKGENIAYFPIKKMFFKNMF